MIDGVLVNQNRVAVAYPLILQQLYAAYQGVSEMERRPRTFAFYSGITNDIQNV